MSLRTYLSESQGGKWAALLALPVALAAVTACGGSESPVAEDATPAAESAPPPMETAKPASGPRVFFVEPQDGATVKSPVTLRFDTENYEISPVPPGELTSARAALGHHHVGVNTDCLPVGTVIPKADPWVHFGDGKNEIQMQLPPGKQRLTLQVGDDLHRTIEGLCSSITVNVE